MSVSGKNGIEIKELKAGNGIRLYKPRLKTDINILAYSSPLILKRTPVNKDKVRTTNKFSSKQMIEELPKRSVNVWNETKIEV